VTLSLPHQGAPWWAVVLLALVGAGVGAWLTRVLADVTYRHLEERVQPSPRHTWWVIAGVALTWAALCYRIGGYAHWSLLPAYLYLGAVGTWLTFIDLDVHRLPDLIVLPSYPIAFVLLLVPTVVTGQWGSLLRAVLAGLGLFILYLLLALLSPGGGGLGFGDVKLAGVLGLLLGWLGWGGVVISVFAAFLIGGLIALALLLARRVSRTSHIAFGPSMLLGAWVAVMFPVRVLGG
jgi:leader peptidase (prepilin peptidase)/N-methyltransferase